MKKILLILFWFVMIVSMPAPVIAADTIADHSSMLSESVVSKTTDNRVTKLQAYLDRHNSPLAQNAQDFVDAADMYGFGENWALVAAIAGNESTLGKFIPRGSYNAWGWGIPTGAQSGIGFRDWKEGIFTVTKGLKENYMNRGADTIEKIAPIYAPPSKTWARNVRWFMNEIESTSTAPSLSL